MNPSEDIVALDENQLNEMDERILDVLLEGRASPTLTLKILKDEEGVDVSRQYIGNRMKRLAEHGHISNLYDTGIYELVEDPRDE
jgi:DNA-binding Lrp family transcriptional regulator